jgi:hypothetical protein
VTSVEANIIEDGAATDDDGAAPDDGGGADNDADDDDGAAAEDDDGAAAEVKVDIDTDGIEPDVGLGDEETVGRRKTV